MTKTKTKVNAKTRQKRKAPGREKSQKVAKWTKEKQFWLLECIVFIPHGKTLWKGYKAGRQSIVLYETVWDY